MAIVGQIGYALSPMIARGAMLGPDQPVILHLLDIPPAATALEGVRMELIDAAYPLVKGECLHTLPIHVSPCYHWLQRKGFIGFKRGGSKSPKAFDMLHGGEY